MPSAFADSDVIISSLLSDRGAAFLLLNQNKNTFFISSFSVSELKIVVGRLGIEKQKLDDLIKKRLKVLDLKENNKKIKEKYGSYVFDENDAHILAGAVKSEVKFLLTYNLKHFKKEKIKEEFDLLIFTPAEFLQYLRSQ